MTHLIPRPHDLLRVRTARESIDFANDADAAFEYVCRDALVVVRRAEDHHGRLAVGVRGDTRSERYAGWVSTKVIVEVIPPAALLDAAASRYAAAFESLAKLKECWSNLASAWGPTGSVGFELASRRNVVHDASDLDILMQLDVPISIEEASRLLEATCDLPSKVDVQVATPAGAFALEEFASANGVVLLKTCKGPLLTSDPWHPQEVA